MPLMVVSVVSFKESKSGIFLASSVRNCQTTTDREWLNRVNIQITWSWERSLLSPPNQWRCPRSMHRSCWPKAFADGSNHTFQQTEALRSVKVIAFPQRALQVQSTKTHTKHTQTSQNISYIIIYIFIYLLLLFFYKQISLEMHSSVPLNALNGIWVEPFKDTFQHRWSSRKRWKRGIHDVLTNPSSPYPIRKKLFEQQL